MNPRHPDLSDLFARYLERQTAAQGEGLASAGPGDEVVPFDAVPVQPIEPRLAWNEALAVLGHFEPSRGARPPAAPPEWSALVAAHDPEVALPFSLGHYPQLVRHLPAVLHAVEAGWQPGRRALGPSTLVEWGRSEAARPEPLACLAAAAVLRLARQFEAAAQVLSAPLPRAWEPLRQNEQAALFWQQGQWGAADSLWQGLSDSAPVLFNRGLASLFLGRPAEARTLLRRATAELPEASGWYHLGQLYLALAEMRRT
jgi:tetratricopeptide (TPR) repeat protein